jgi:glycosyltransferase involved in cell wall biosynthesis
VSRILIVATDVVASRMAGPGIRCFELARQLQQAGHQVTLAAAGSADLTGEAVTLVPQPTPVEMDALARSHDAVLVQGFALRAYPSLRHLDLPLIVDLYDPFPLSLLEQEKHLPGRERQAHSLRVRGILDELLRCGDFFLCASERQRDLWIGSLVAVGRVNPQTWSADDSLRRLIDVVPFGLPESPPQSSGATPPGFPLEVSEGDLVVLWGGGIYNWFDPLTLIRAIARIAPNQPRMKLVFMSTDHPNPGVPGQMWMPERARQLAAELGLEGRQVLFNKEWVPYYRRADWLLAADCGVSTHFDHAETRYSFRTRILDYLWAGLPIITTAGDVLADLVQQRGLGWTVPAEDVTALAVALEELAATGQAERRAMNGRVLATAVEMTWGRAAQPLLRFCEQLQLAPDSPRNELITNGPPSAVQLRLEKPRRLVLAGLTSLRQQGVAATVRRIGAWWGRRRIP